jgi:hypothetical protein
VPFFRKSFAKKLFVASLFRFGGKKSKKLRVLKSNCIKSKPLLQPPNFAVCRLTLQCVYDKIKKRQMPPCSCTAAQGLHYLFRSRKG